MYGNGKQNSRTFPGLFQDFSHFQGLNFFPILNKTARTNALFSARNVEVEIEISLIMISEIKAGTTAQIE